MLPKIANIWIAALASFQPVTSAVSTYAHIYETIGSNLTFSVLTGSRPSDHYFRSVCLSVCLFVCMFVCLFVCAEFFSAVFDPISIKLGHMLYVLI